MTSTGRRGFVAVDRRWLVSTELSDSALRLMMWLDSHTHEYLSNVGVARIARETGWSRNRVKRALADLEQLGLVTVEMVEDPIVMQRNVITLHQSEWTERNGPTLVHDGPGGGSTTDQAPLVHDGPATTSKHSEVEEHSQDAEFDVFWVLYPRKVGKPAAAKAYKAACKQHSEADVLKGTERWVQFWATSQTEERFIPHPSTFLNQHRFNDPTPTPEQKKDAMSLLRKVAERDNT